MEKLMKKYNWQEYTTKEGLRNMIGEIEDDDLPRLLVKELLDNAIDVNRKTQQGKKRTDYIPCELGITEKGFYIRDYGSGISENHIKDIFSLKRNFSYSSKYIRTVSRGMLGKGLKVVLGICCILGGKIKVFSQGKSYDIIPDKKSGEVEINIADGDIREGTRIEVEFEQNVFDKSFLSWGENTLKLDKTWFYTGYTNPWWYSDEDIRILLTNYSEQDPVKKFAKEIFNIKLKKDSKFYKLKVKDLLNEKDLTIGDFLKELRSKSNPNVKFNKIGKLKGYEYYKYFSDYNNSNDKRIPYTIEVWAKKVPSHIEIEFYISDFKLFINGSFNSEERCKIIKNKEDFITKNQYFTVKNPKCNMEVIVNILIPWIQTKGDGKELILDYHIKKNIEKILNDIVNEMRNKSNKLKNKTTSKIRLIDKFEEIIGEDCIREAREKAEELRNKMNDMQLNISGINHNLSKALTDHGIYKAAWFYYWWKKLGEPELIHLRRIHYHLVSRDVNYVVNKEIVRYENIKKCWQYLSNASTYARILRLVNPKVIIDRRNPQMVNELTSPSKEICLYEEKIPLLDLINDPYNIQYPKLDVKFSYSGADQPNIVAVVAEKTTINDIIEPLQQKYQFFFQPAQGFLSYTIAYNLASLVKEYKKPLIILYISDFDPSGMDMPPSLAQQLETEFIQQGLYDWGNLKIVHVALTREQVERYKLPSNPDIEKNRYEEFKRKYGIPPTELDALEAYFPGEIEKILVSELSHYMDISMPDKMEERRNNILENIKMFIQEDDGLNMVKEKIESKYKNIIFEIVKNNRHNLNELSQMLSQYKDILTNYAIELEPKLNNIPPTLNLDESSSKIVLDILETFRNGIGYYLMKKN